MHLSYSFLVHVNLRLVDAMGAASGAQSEGRTRMRKLICLAAVAALALTLGAGSAAAQRSVYDYDDAAAWWASFDCAGMKRILPMNLGADGAVGGTGNDADESASAHEARVCSMTLSGLKTNELRAVQDFVMGLNNGPFLNHKAFWDDTTNAVCLTRARVAGRAGIEVTGVTPLPANIAAPATGTLIENQYCVGYDMLAGTGVKGNVDMYLNALSGRGMMTDDDDDDTADAPALPLVGVGLLGLLLAGRGAWLRRRA